MLAIKLDDKKIKVLKQIASEKNYSSSAKAKIKAEIILLRNEGYSIKEICKKTGLCKNTILNYIKGYINHPTNGMMFIHQNKYKKSELEKYKEKIIAEFKNNPIMSYREATERIKKIFNITKAENTVRIFLNKHNIYTNRGLDNKKDKDRKTRNAKSDRI